MKLNNNKNNCHHCGPNPIQFSSSDAAVSIGHALQPVAVEAVMAVMSKENNICCLFLGLHCSGIKSGNLDRTFGSSVKEILAESEIMPINKLCMIQIIRARLGHLLWI